MKHLMTMAVALALTVPVHAETVTFDAGGITVDVPAGWKAKNDKALTVESPDGNVTVGFIALPEKGADKASAAVEKVLEQYTGKVTWEDKPEKEKVNDIDAEVWDGTAKEGKLQVEAIYLDTGDKEVAVYWYDTKESEAKYKKETDALYKSIKKVAKK